MRLEIGLGKRVVVIGVGNILLRDDGVGVHVVRELGDELTSGSISVYECGTLGLQILDYLDGADFVVIVDAVRSGKQPGVVSRFLIDQSKLEDPMELQSMHQVGVLDTLSLGRRIVRLPDQIVVVGVEPKDVSLGLDLSDEVKGSVQAAVRMVLDEIGFAQ